MDIPIKKFSPFALLATIVLHCFRQIFHELSVMIWIINDIFIGYKGQTGSFNYMVRDEIKV